VRHSEHMTREIPGPLRAAAGLAAVAVDEARRLPSRLAGLPVLAVGAAMQASMRAQQRYAELLGRGDQVLAHLRESDEQPPWARFDEDDGERPEPAAGGYDDDGSTDWPFTDDEVEARLADLDAEPADTPDGDVEAVYAPAADPATPDLASTSADTVNGHRAGGAALLNSDKPAKKATKAGKSTRAARPKKAESGDLPLANYDSLTLPQLRARISKLTTTELTALLDHERRHAARPPYLTMLENRLTRLRTS
jgi:hypothetical protein